MRIPEPRSHQFALDIVSMLAHSLATLSKAILNTRIQIRRTSSSHYTYYHPYKYIHLLRMVAAH